MGRRSPRDQEFFALSRYPNVYLKLTPLNVEPQGLGQGDAGNILSAR